MFHQLKNIGDTLLPVEEVSYPLNVINEVNNKMKMVNMAIKTYHIVVAVLFEAAAVHLSNYIPEVRANRGIFSIETELEVKVNIQEY